MRKDIKIESIKENKKKVCGIVKKCNHYYENIVELCCVNNFFLIKITGDIKFSNIMVM